MKYKQYCLVLADKSAGEEERVLAELHKSKLKAFKEAAKDKGDAGQNSLLQIK